MNNNHTDDASRNHKEISITKSQKRDVKEVSFMNNYNIEKALLQALFEERSNTRSRFTLPIVNLLIKLFSKYDKIYPSQGNIAEWIGCSRQTVNEVLSYLHEVGLIKKIYRHRHSCLYVLSTKFNLIASNSLARSILPALKDLYFKLIAQWAKGSCTAAFTPYPTPYKEEEDILVVKSTFVSKMCSKISSLVSETTNKFLKKLKNEDQNKMNNRNRHKTYATNPKSFQISSIEQRNKELTKIGYYVDRRKHMDKKEVNPEYAQFVWNE